MKQKYYYLSGIPRSGSTVLATILSQNPEIFTTPTSPLLDLILLTGNNWNNVSTFQKNHHPSQLRNIYRGIFDSVYQHTEKSIILDKHRAWVRHVPMIINVTGEIPKIIVTTRNISEVLASYISILRKSTQPTYIDIELTGSNKPVNDTTRCRLLWEKYISNPWTSLKLGYENHRKCLHLIDYDDITNKPEQTITDIYKFLELPPYKHEFVSLTNPQPENDIAYGIAGLHDVRPELKRTSPSSDEILGAKLAEHYRDLKLEFWK